MTRVLCITNSYPIHPRLRKIGSLFENAEVRYLGWDRIHACEIPKSDEFIHQSTNGYGTAIQVLKGMLPFVNYAKKILREYRPDVVVLRHWSTAFLLLPFLPRQAKIIYDVSDMPDSDAKLPQWIYRQLEQLVIWRSQQLIFSSSYYAPFYPKAQKKAVVLENKTPIQMSVHRPHKPKLGGERLVVSYIGMIRYFETLVPLIEAAQGLPIELKFYGTGSEVNRLKQYCKERHYTSIYFHGVYDYQEIHHYYREADLVYGAYPSNNTNVKVSIPNRYFESIVFECPLIASSQTAVGDLVEKHGIGYVVDGYDSTSIRLLLESLLQDPEDLNQKKIALQMYQIEHSVYWEDYRNSVKLF